ncbi:ABC transporter permease [Crassaminicella profunda]|uniref:ABC transporter permease n=1 Tax=Crassaminicella profunda TaxID=1286698 RepID=UPI001CA74640|nr:ABC transporter permease [Crassaminicella profunda]QZY54795.1 ABC transporter permease [Crassaminicella profunda]
MKKKYLSIPYALWSLIFSIAPIMIILVYSFCKRSPYGRIVYEFTLNNYKTFMEPIYLNVLWRSMILAAISTIICLIIAYPMAMIIAKSPLKRRNILIMLFIVPLWTNFLLRTYAWMILLRDQGIINQFLIGLGIIDEPLGLLYNAGAVVLGMVYNFLPFMVLPIYSVLVKIDESLIEAAMDLGATSREVFMKVVFPLSIPGVVSGLIMVFMPAVSTFVISDLLGGGQTILLGNLIQNQFLFARNWQFGSAISMIMMVLILIGMAVSHKYQDEEGGGLW